MPVIAYDTDASGEKPTAAELEEQVRAAAKVAITMCPRTAVAAPAGHMVEAKKP